MGVLRTNILGGRNTKRAAKTSINGHSYWMRECPLAAVNFFRHTRDQIPFDNFASPHNLDS